MNKTRVYLHNSNDSSEIRHNLREDGVPEELVETMLEEISGRFYEVGFDVTFNDKGKITDVEMIKKS